jgi:hypothetical protein
MEKVNGVNVITENCDKCVCRKCSQWDHVIREKKYIKCPYENKPCYGCNKLTYADDCIFGTVNDIPEELWK